MNDIHPSNRRRMAQAVHLHQSGDYSRAEKLYREVVQQEPELADARHLLGLLAHQTGRTELAIEMMQASLRLAPGNSGFLNNLGGVYLSNNQPDEAIKYFSQAVKADPHYAEAWHHLGIAWYRKNLLPEAVSCWQHALNCNPHLKDTLLLLAESLHALGWMDEAVAVYRAAAERYPGDPELLIDYAAALCDTRESRQALLLLDQAAGISPDNPRLHYHKGVAHEQFGEFSRAREAFTTAIALKADFYQAYLDLAMLKNLGLESPVTRHLLEVTAPNHELGNEDAVYAHFAVANILDDNQEYEAAFNHYKAGNDLRRERLVYDNQSQIDYFESIKKSFDENFLHRPVNTENRKLIFIVGMPRSGTTLIEQLLAGHPAAFGAGELTILHDELRKQLGAYRDPRELPPAISSLSDRALSNLASICHAKINALAPEKEIVIDKMPSNFMYLGLLRVLFPNSYVIHCTRDPMDTCLSCYTTLFKRGHEFSYGLRELGQFYNLYADLMRHWETMLPEDRLLTVNYESLVTDTEENLRNMFSRCGLSWDKSILDGGSRSTQIRSASVYQARQPVTAKSVGRWRRYSQWLEPLASALTSGASRA